jgi:hypothetical protein
MSPTGGRERSDGFRHLRDGRRLENDSERQINHQRAADHTDHMDRQQRVAAEVEELVMKTDAIALEEVGADPGEELFERAGWRDMASASPALGPGAGKALRSSLPLAVSGNVQGSRRPTFGTLSDIAPCLCRRRRSRRRFGPGICVISGASLMSECGQLRHGQVWSQPPYVEGAHHGRRTSASKPADP